MILSVRSLSFVFQKSIVVMVLWWLDYRIGSTHGSTNPVDREMDPTQRGQPAGTAMTVSIELYANKVHE